MVTSLTQLRAAKKANKELEINNRELERTKRALLNVMEDLEMAHVLLEREKAKDEAIFASIGDGLIAIDTNRRIMMLNTVAEELLDCKSEELLGKEISSFSLLDTEGCYVPDHMRPTALALRTGKVVNGVYIFLRQDGKKFPLALNVTPIKLGGQIIGAIDTFRDISREIEVDKAKSEFVSLASHQLRTPLGIIKWYLEAIENEEYSKQATPVIKEYMQEVHKSNERVLNLVRDLLSVSRIDQGKVKNNPTKVDCVEIIEHAVGQMQIIARKKKVSLQLKPCKHAFPMVMVDELRFHDVIENLISNAISYTKQNGFIEVTVQKKNDRLNVEVCDTGIGISREDQRKLFTKFFRSENAIDYNPEGTGLGLYVVKSYVESWGGRTSVVSQEGHGSTFTIELPTQGETL